MEQLMGEIQQLSDDRLMEQLVLHHDDYTPEALSLLKDEVEKRQLDLEKYKQVISEKHTSDINFIQLDTKDFKPFDHTFNRIDLELAAVILRDYQIPFYADNPQSSDVIPLETEAERRFTIHVHASGIQKAHELLDEHFEKIEGMYRLKKMNTREQLKSFNFYELQLSEKEAAELVEVVFTEQERAAIANYGKQLLERSEEIEKKQDRVLFYYDTVEMLLDNISAWKSCTFSKTELLAILEILQVFCDDSGFPGFLDEVISNLLGFFISHRNDS